MPLKGEAIVSAIISVGVQGYLNILSACSTVVICIVCWRGIMYYCCHVVCMYV